MRNHHQKKRARAFGRFRSARWGICLWVLSARHCCVCRFSRPRWAVDRGVGFRFHCFPLGPRAAMNTEAERKATEIRLRAERRAGELFAKMERGKAGRPKKKGAMV